MHRRSVLLLSICLCAAWLSADGQEIRLFDRPIQIHGFASLGFVHTNNNNWLTMNTSHVGSGEFTDFGLNASVQITDEFRVGAQVYDRNVGEIGKCDGCGEAVGLCCQPFTDGARGQHPVRRQSLSAAGVSEAGTA